MLGIKLSEVGDSIFEIPPARVGHSAKDNVVRKKIESRQRDLRGICLRYGIGLAAT